MWDILKCQKFVIHFLAVTHAHALVVSLLRFLSLFRFVKTLSWLYNVWRALCIEPRIVRVSCRKRTMERTKAQSKETINTHEKLNWGSALQMICIVEYIGRNVYNTHCTRYSLHTSHFSYVYIIINHHRLSEKKKDTDIERETENEHEHEQ